MSGSRSAEGVSARRTFRDPSPPVVPAAQPPAPATIPPRMPTASVGEVLELLVQRFPKELRSTSRFEGPITALLRRLEQTERETWQDRWVAFEKLTGPDGWREAVLPDAPIWRHEYLNIAVRLLLTVDLFRPSHRWLHSVKMVGLHAVSAARDSQAAEMLSVKLSQGGTHPQRNEKALRTGARIQIHTGKSLRQLTAEDLLETMADLSYLRSIQSLQLNLLWPALRELGWLEHPAHEFPGRRRRGQMTAEQLVDFHGVVGPVREVFVEYLKNRSAQLDYSSLRGLARNLCKHFWANVVTDNPTQHSLVLTREQAEAWKQRARLHHDGSPREFYGIFYAVRSFYLDVSQWALEDSFWAPWVASSPISAAETRGEAKRKRRVVAENHQRTRDLSGVVGQLVDAADRTLKDAEARLRDARRAGPGGTIDVDGEPWAVSQRDTTSPFQATREGRRRNLEMEEEDAFWAWAILETLRHSGIRLEELLELTHLSIQPYKVPATGETIPLLHLVASKTDTERLLVAGPELVHVLYRILSRVLVDGRVPVTQRWDPNERTLGSLLPHLFIRPTTARGGRYRVMSPTTVKALLDRLAERAGITLHDQAVRFTPIDFRRLFATDALASGLPPHIVQVLMGHKSIATTQGYAAIYPQDVIRHHRTFIAQRRATRPSEEYREPTAEEWDEFEAHFVQRKLSLGSCGRAYGTQCHHEHACLRCALLRPDPGQIERLNDIIENLKERILEAEAQGWLGDVEGLRVTVAGAELKREQMRRQISQADEPVVLGLPRIGSGSDSE